MIQDHIQKHDQSSQIYKLKNKHSYIANNGKRRARCLKLKEKLR